MSLARPASAFSTPALAALLLVLGGLLAYHNAYDAPFVFDDLTSIPGNPTLERLHTAWSPPVGGSLTVEGRPLLNVSFALNRRLTGPGPAGYRATNVAIHLLAALTLFGLVRRTLAGPCFSPAARAVAGSVALVTALLWELHPLQTESVTYIVQRAESLMGLLYLFTLYAFVRGAAAPGRRGWLALSVAACLAGMAVKEVMATAPLMVLLHDRTFVAGSFVAAWRERRGYYLALAGTWLLLAALVFASGGNRSGIMGLGAGVSWVAYVLAQSEAVGRYLGLALWPHPLVFEYGLFRPRAWTELLPWLAVTVPLAAGVLLALWRRPIPGYVGAWFLLLLAPTSLMPSTTQIIVEHRMYLPLAAVTVFAAAVVLPGALSSRYRCATWAGVSALTTALLLLTVARNRTYGSEISLWRDTVAKRPDNALAHHILGEALEKAGGGADALGHYARATELRPEFILPRVGLARLLLQTGRNEEAQREAERVLVLQPDSTTAREVLGTVHSRAERWDDAAAQFRAALAAVPGRSDLRYLLALVLARAGRISEAIAEYERVTREQPDHAAAHFNLANLWREGGRLPQAIAAYRAALQARPDHARARNNLANLLASTGCWSEAVEHYQEALRAEPASAEMHFNLASTLIRLGRNTEATSHYEAALRLSPDSAAAQAALLELQSSVRK